MKPGEFRKDINGLRAWAVLAVVLYHFGVQGFGRGFLGVDIFFVISGFFMAKIVLTPLERSGFSLFSFYLSRARRIWPALLVLVAAVVLLGWFILMPAEYKQMGKHARDSLQFVSNLRYLNEAGYFDTASREKWFLHTWSLSIEWQFYLLYPFVLLLFRKYAADRRLMLLVHLALLLVSLACSVWLNSAAPDRAYYLLRSRAWELLAGGAVFILSASVRNGIAAGRLTEGTGLALILAALAIPFPGNHWTVFSALMAVCGTALVILAARGNDSRWTGNAAMQWIGSRSYSIYLWHWPVAVLLFYFGLQRTFVWMVAGMAASLLLGHVSFRLVEMPAQKWLARRGRWLAALILLSCLAAGILGSQQVRKSGFPARLPEEIVRIEKNAMPADVATADCDDMLACAYGGSDVRAIVVGDSHAHALVGSVVNGLPDPEGGVYLRAAAGCPIVFGARLAGHSNQQACEAVHNDLLGGLGESYPGLPMIIITRTPLYVLGDNDGGNIDSGNQPWVYFSRPVSDATPEFLSDFEKHYVDTVCRLNEKHPVYLMRPLPEFSSPVPQMMGRAALLGKDTEVKIPREEYERRASFIWKVQDSAVRRCGVSLLDSAARLCDTRYCYGSVDGNALFYDTDHMGRNGARLLTPMFGEIFDAR